MNYNLARFNMVRQQVRAANVSNARVLDLIATAPREHFVLEAYQKLAFSDAFVPMLHNQVMLPPNIVGKLLQAVNLSEEDSVLEIGTGTGYVTYLIAKLAKQVVSMEIFPDLKELAENNLKSFSITNTQLILADAFTHTDCQHLAQSEKMNLNAQKFDVIIFTGSVFSLPKQYKECLTENGRLFAFIGQWPVLSSYLITRKGNEQWVTQSLFETFVPSLISTQQNNVFHF